jgi:hypothetical protein
MGFLLNPQTGSEVTFLERLSAIGAGNYTAFILSCEQYTKQVVESKKIDQTPPKSFTYYLKLFAVAGVVLFIIYKLVFKRKKK